MSLDPEQLRSVSFLKGFTDRQLEQLAPVFKKQNYDARETLFRAGMLDDCFYLLAKGEVSIFEGNMLRYRLQPPTPIGELGTLANIKRNATATVTKPSEIWKIKRDDLLRFFTTNKETALLFYQNFLTGIADRVRRDQTRLEDMRSNIIRTQKAMKQMRDLILQSKDTPISETLHNELEILIGQNRRVNYRVEPPQSMPAELRLNEKHVSRVVEISRTHISFMLEDGSLPQKDDVVTGVLCLNGTEVLISGKVLRTIGNRVDLELDYLINSYGFILDGYLARIQMLDHLV